ncbi:hypothetical protein MTF65_10255 [Streptomyces sp. APSN-46.1]|uniref:hypothetical protein n=1 Tax=Streptomyces sp. APSN-46.1 TaxID=2929049 RepID=UPI001FB323C5|nr:hypothetical protein [Streptomyces sp. APSN-46.1]MCJ1677714.1 hypothetical protein [Streptomyces sp. APSN-46.1]
MADERNRWLDEAAADRLLRGESVAPVADPLAQAEAARLRAALDALAPSAPHPAAGPELPGEAAALAAFRAAHGGIRPEAAEATPYAPAPLVELARGSQTVFVRPPRRSTTVRFGLAAALASVAVGGLAAAAGTGLLDQTLNASAGPLPSVSVSSGPHPESTRDGDGAQPLRSPQLRPTSPFGGEGAGSAGSSPTAGADGGTSSGADTGNSSEPASVGGTGKDATPDKFRDGAKDRDRDPDRESTVKAADLCEDYRMGRLNDDRRERLTKLARGAARIAKYCEALLDGARESDTSGGSAGSGGTGSSGGAGSDILQVPTPAASAGSLLFRSLP